MQIIKDMELPISARSGTRGSKFFSAEIAELVAKLQPKEGFVVPFMDMGTVKDPAKRQRYATWYRVTEWAKEQGKPAQKDAEGNIIAEAVPAPKFTVAILLDAKDDKGKVLRDGGIAIRRDV